MKPIARRWQQVNDWFFGGTSDHWLAALRIGLGLQLVLYCITSRADWLQMFTLHPGSFVTRDLTEALVTLGAALVPRVSWLISVGEFIGLSEATVLWVVWSGLLAAGLCLVAGIFCRSAAIAAWFLHLSAIKSSALLSYGVDNFTSIGLFYLMLSPLPDHLSLGFALAKVAAEERPAAKFLATRSSVAPVRHLLFQRPDQASRQWMVEWGKSLARLNSPSV